MSFIRNACISTVSMLLMACASIEAPSPEQVVTKRAEARWNHLIKGDYASAYRFTEPSYRGLVSLSTFQNGIASGSGVMWTAATVVSAKCESDRCDVSVNIDAKALAGASRIPITGAVDEIWLKTDGEWFIYIKP